MCFVLEGRKPSLVLLLGLVALWGCASQSGVRPTAVSPTDVPTSTPAPTDAGTATALADVRSVEVSGEPGDYRFSVEVRSPDEGCEQYADWWEVLTAEGELLYRRILAHSHTNEQPFVRSGGPVTIEPDTPVVVRAHMHPTGYGGQTLQGTVEDGFEVVDLSPDFASEVEDAPPQPEGCAF